VKFGWLPSPATVDANRTTTNRSEVMSTVHGPRPPQAPAKAKNRAGLAGVAVRAIPVVP
jgi:hypothetical protein